MAEQTTKLSIAESLYGSDDPKTPETEPNPGAKPEIEAPAKKVPDGHVDGDPKPPSKEEAAKETDVSSLDWMDKEPKPSHSEDGEAKKSKVLDVEIEYNGRKIKASELQQEAKNLESGYTTKTMELADKRKNLDTELSVVETQKNELAASLTEVENFLAPIVAKEPDWEKLKEELDTDEFVLKKIEFEDAKEKLQKVRVANQKLANDQLQQKALHEVGILTDKYYPEWKDAKVCEDHISSIIAGASKHYGYDKSELKHILYDNRLFRMVADANKWRDHKATQKSIAGKKDIDTIPTTVKPSGEKLDKKVDTTEVKTMSEQMYPQYDTETAGV